MEVLNSALGGAHAEAMVLGKVGGEDAATRVVRDDGGTVDSDILSVLWEYVGLIDGEGE